MNGTSISCCCKVCPLIQIHSVLFGSPGSPRFHDDIASSCWNVLLWLSLFRTRDKPSVEVWARMGGFCSCFVVVVVTIPLWVEVLADWLTSDRSLETKLWVLHSGAMTKTRAWSSCSFWRILDNMLKGGKIYTYLFSQLKLTYCVCCIRVCMPRHKGFELIIMSWGNKSISGFSHLFIKKLKTFGFSCHSVLSWNFLAEFVCSCILNSRNVSGS